MNAGVVIVAIGRELVNGRTLDTNSRSLARSCTMLGLRVTGIHVIDDVASDIVKTMRSALATRPLLIITTGGLGPTADDMTLASVARAVKRTIVKNRRAVAMLERRYTQLYRKGLLHTKGWNEGRIKMAMLPARATPLRNPAGTAPAALLKQGPTTIVCLPGVPAEALAIFDDSVTAWIRRHGPRNVWYERSLKTGSYDESVLRDQLDRVSAAFPDVYIKSSPAGFLKEKSLEVFFTSTGSSKAQVVRRVKGAMDLLRRLMRAGS